jgi:hypothetical protein
LLFAAEPILPGRRPHSQVLREPTASAVEAREEELPRTTIADIAGAVLPQSNKAERARPTIAKARSRQLTLRN